MPLTNNDDNTPANGGRLKPRQRGFTSSDRKVCSKTAKAASHCTQTGLAGCSAKCPNIKPATRMRVWRLCLSPQEGTTRTVCPKICAKAQLGRCAPRYAQRHN